MKRRAEELEQITPPLPARPRPSDPAMASAVAARAKERFEALQAERGRGDLDGGEDGELKDFSDLELKADHGAQGAGNHQ